MGCRVPLAVLLRENPFVPAIVAARLAGRCVRDASQAFEGRDSDSMAERAWLRGALPKRGRTSWVPTRCIVLAGALQAVVVRGFSDGSGWWAGLVQTEVMLMAWRWVATNFGGPEVLEQVNVNLAPPAPDEVTIEVRAAGMNPADYKHFAPGQDRSLLPLTVGYEVAGVVSAMGRGAALASGGGAVGDEVVAYPIIGGYASAITVKASDVFAKPRVLSFAQAANLLLVGTTAAEMLFVTHVTDRKSSCFMARRARWAQALCSRRTFWALA